MTFRWHVLLTLIPAMVCQNCTIQYDDMGKKSLYLFYIENPKGGQLNCSTVFPKHFIFDGRLATMGEGVNTILYFVRQANITDLLSLQLVEQGTICDKKIWFTNVPNFVIGYLEDFKRLVPDNKDRKFIKYSSVDMAYSKMISTCKIGYLENRTFLDYIMKEQPSVFYVLLFLLALAVCIVLIYCFNMFVNCCFLARIKKKDAGICPILNCFSSSLTNRYIFLKHEEDIDMLANVCESQYKNDMKSPDTQYTVVENDIYKL